MRMPIGLLALSALVPLAGPAAGRMAARVAPPSYEVYAVRYGTLKAFPLSGLVAGADSTKRIDAALMVWLLRGDGRTVLLDAGFYRDRFVNRWKPADFERPSQAIVRAGVKPEDVTDIIVSHVHWDHLDGADLFPRARIWIQKAEYEYYVDEHGRRLNNGIDSADAMMLHALRRAGRVQFVDGDAKEILPGIVAYTGGRHTYASQYVGVYTDAGTVVLASDNAYLYQNLEQRIPIAQTFDSSSNRQAQARMLQLAGSARLVVPGHDAEVFARFPTPGNGVARIRD